LKPKEILEYANSLNEPDDEVCQAILKYYDPNCDCILGVRYEQDYDEWIATICECVLARCEELSNG